MRGGGKGKGKGKVMAVTFLITYREECDVMRSVPLAAFVLHFFIDEIAERIKVLLESLVSAIQQQNDRVCSLRLDSLLYQVLLFEADSFYFFCIHFTICCCYDFYSIAIRRVVES